MIILYCFLFRVNQLSFRLYAQALVCIAYVTKDFEKALFMGAYALQKLINN